MGCSHIGWQADNHLLLLRRGWRNVVGLEALVWLKTLIRLISLIRLESLVWLETLVWLILVISLNFIDLCI